MAGRRVAGVKVVIINTQYVETDAMSFKSVVQNLTGKDSHIQDANLQQQPPRINLQSSTPIACNMAPLFLSHGMSFSDFEFEWTPKELPPLDELLQALR
ncbi:VQ motif-containing protein 1-like [Primulina eburnea]|uniref:VQ motif-containing protein 1-like n=1 Tax=Primulina eburnea TaxID=1245227 RepID=UPI003C6C3F36